MEHKIIVGKDTYWFNTDVFCPACGVKGYVWDKSPRPQYSGDAESVCIACCSKFDTPYVWNDEAEPSVIDAISRYMESES